MALTEKGSAARFSVAAALVVVAALLSTIVVGSSVAAQTAASGEIIFTTYLEANFDGRQDPGEGPVDVDLRLVSTTDPTSTVTGAPQSDGSIRFADLEPGWHEFVIGPAGLADHAYFLFSFPHSFSVRVVAGETLTVSRPVARGGFVNFEVDDPASDVFFLATPWLFTSVRGADPTSVALPPGIHQVGIEGRMGSAITAVTCDGVALSPIGTPGPRNWTVNLPVGLGAAVQCIIETADVDTVDVTFSSPSGWASVSFEADDLYLPLQPPYFSGIAQMAPGTHVARVALVSGGSGSAALRCDQATATKVDSARWELTFEPGSQPTCTIEEQARTSSFTLINGNANRPSHPPPQSHPGASAHDG